MGKPGHRHGWSPAREGTWGTETSKYPEEKKTKVIPKVVASEIGRGQTARSNMCGVVDGDIGKLR